MAQATVIDNNKRLIMQIITIIVVVIIIAAIVKAYKGAKAAGSAVGDLLGGEIIAQQTGISVARQSVCQTVANDAHYAIHGDGGLLGIFSTWTEDEEAVINALNKLVSPAEAAYTSQLYSRLWGNKNLKSDVAQYLNKTEQGRINSTILNALQ